MPLAGIYIRKKKSVGRSLGDGEKADGNHCHLERDLRGNTSELLATSLLRCIPCGCGCCSGWTSVLAMAMFEVGRFFRWCITQMEDEVRRTRVQWETRRKTRLAMLEYVIMSPVCEHRLLARATSLSEQQRAFLSHATISNGCPPKHSCGRSCFQCVICLSARGWDGLRVQLWGVTEMEP